MRFRRLTALLAVLAALLTALLLAAPARAAEQVVTITTGMLDSPPTLRDYGLPVALAAVLAAGVVSLLVRLLLAEPETHRRTPGLACPTAVPTVG